MNWFKKLFATTKVDEHPQTKNETAKNRDYYYVGKGWYHIGDFTLDYDRYSEGIPAWVRDKIPDSHPKALKHNYHYRKVGRPYDGRWFLRGKHFLYRIEFVNYDDYVKGDVFRRDRR